MLIFRHPESHGMISFMIIDEVLNATQQLNSPLDARC